MSFRFRLAVWIWAVVTVSSAFIVVTALAVHGRTHYNSLDLELMDDAEHYRSLVLAAVDPHVPAVVPQFESATAAHLYATDGRLVTRPASVEGQPPLGPLEVVERNDGPSYGLPWSWIPRGDEFDQGWYATVRDSDTGDRVRLYVQEFDDLPGDARYVLTWTSLARLDRSIEQFRVLMLGLGFVGMLVALAGGVIAARQVLNPISTVMRTARAIAASRAFTRRVPERREQDEMGQLTRTLNEMLQSLEDAYRVQQQFVADAAHELRTPLTAIRGNVHVLARLEGVDGDHAQRGGDPAADRAEAIGYLESESARMSQMVDELLTLARADSGLEMDRRPVELDAVLLTVVAELSVVAGRREVRVGQIEPVRVLGDGLRLKQLILIVLDNALKYTDPAGEVTIALERANDEAVLNVEDTGIGIAKDDIPRLFERFYRGDEGRAYYPEGTGLGLAIARWVVETHGGDIAIESERGAGTRVTIRLPIMQ